MKIKSLILSLAASMFLFIACSDDGNTPEPLTRTETIDYLSKRWMVNETTGYKSFQFDKDGNYIIEKVNKDKADGIELISGTYTLGEDLKTISFESSDDKFIITSLSDKSIGFTYKNANFSTTTTGEVLPMPEPAKLEKFYSFCYSDDVEELAEIDINTGKLIWTGYKVLDVWGNSRGYIFNSNDEFVTLGFNTDSKLILTKGKLSDKKVTTYPIIVDKPNAVDFDNIIEHNGKYYSFCYSDDVEELAEIDINTGKLIWTGYKVPDVWGNSRGYVFSADSEFITLGFNTDSKLILTKGKLSDKKVTTLPIVNDKPNAEDFDNIIKK